MKCGSREWVHVATPSARIRGTGSYPMEFTRRQIRSCGWVYRRPQEGTHILEAP